MHVVKRSKRRQHIDACAKLLVKRDMDWFTEGNAYLCHYWQHGELQTLFKTYQEFAEEVSYAMNRILLGRRRQGRPVLRLVSNRRRD